MNYTLNPLPCAVLCDFVHSEGYKGTKKGTFLSESLNFSWKKKKSLLWKLKLKINTFLPTTPGCLKECPKISTFLSQSKEHPPHTHTHTPNSICTRKLRFVVSLLRPCSCRCCAFTSLTDTLNFHHLAFALVITSKGMTPECVKCNTDHHGG